MLESKESMWLGDYEDLYEIDMDGLTGGIGESRLCMLLMGKAHIGEVQSSMWDDETIKLAKEKGIKIL